jgi:hypothetical protein
MWSSGERKTSALSLLYRDNFLTTIGPLDNPCDTRVFLIMVIKKCVLTKVSTLVLAMKEIREVESNVLEKTDGFSRTEIRE